MLMTFGPSAAVLLLIVGGALTGMVALLWSWSPEPPVSHDPEAEYRKLLKRLRGPEYVAVTNERTWDVGENRWN